MVLPAPLAPMMPTICCVDLDVDVARGDDRAEGLVEIADGEDRVRRAGRCAPAAAAATTTDAVGQEQDREQQRPTPSTICQL